MAPPYDHEAIHPHEYVEAFEKYIEGGYQRDSKDSGKNVITVSLLIFVHRMPCVMCFQLPDPGCRHRRGSSRLPLRN